ncbi:hypothetical protein PEBR_15830 [Penicillium brasilianum]|uniref:Integral membrane protein n=1 Tax=Penicillium brasilianum TaxID=104259 RepID=A0A1S9RQH2_PENBI|nr:hypothetical protein PEBR_15830 [Penicillium brasilianum]
MPSPFESAPRGIMVLNNFLFASAAYFADCSESHLFNSRWPPHAKFHNGQSMSFGALAAGLAIYLLCRRSLALEAAKDNLFSAACVGSLTTIAGLSAIFYPGTAWVDPEFASGARIAPQVYVFWGQLLINWCAYVLEKGRLDKREKQKRSI